MAPQFGAISFFNNIMTLDRTLAPSYQAFQEISLPQMQTIILKNEQPLYVIDTATQPVIRFELFFNAGNKFEEKTGQSFFCNKMLAEGTSKFSSTEMAESFATIGYFYEFSQGAERASITLNGLTKHFQKAVEILIEILSDSIFPEKELQNLKTISLQQILVNNEKTAYIASQIFKEEIFGKNHYIGRSIKEADIELISPFDLVSFYEKYYKEKEFKIVVAGQINADIIQIIENSFGLLEVNFETKDHEKEANARYEGKQILIEKEGALQSSIRIGRRAISRTHPDYFALKVCNTILGGYFGSRLMKNIREEKGYTYGISSSHLPLPKFGYLLIGTDVKREFTQNTIDEIFKEITTLQQNKVPADELEVVKNFLSGDFAGSVNSPFDIADKHKTILFEHLESTFFNNYVSQIQKITSDQVLEMANKYFKREDLIEIVVGGK